MDVITKDEGVRRLTELELAYREFQEKIVSLWITHYRIEIDCRALWPFDEDPPAIKI